MADHIRTIDRILQTRPIDMRTLLRLATWGCAAAAALMLAVLSVTSGSHRVMVAAATPTQVDAARSSLPAATAQLAARAAEVESTTRQLTEAVGGLAADRDRLVTRIASLERNLEDVTGSIKQQAAAPPAPVRDPATLPALTPAAPATAAPAPRPQTQEQAPAPAMAATAPTAPAAAPEPTRSASAPVEPVPETDPSKSRIVDFGIDIGGAATFDGLRALWNSVRASTADMFEDLHPMVAVRENRSRGVDLRLVLGPITSTEAATQMCATLLAARRYCQMTIFEGQPLPQTAPTPEPERRPAQTSRTSGQAKARPAPRP